MVVMKSAELKQGVIMDTSGFKLSLFLGDKVQIISKLNINNKNQHHEWA